MPHKCVKCEQVYDEDLPDVETGCACGSRVFLFMRGSTQPDLLAAVQQRDGKYDIDLSWLFGGERKQFDQESVDVVEDGKYNINLRGALGLNNREE